MQIIIDIKRILIEARKNVYRNINKVMLDAYWLIGKRTVEEEQHGASRAAYGKATMKKLSKELQKEFGQGFSIRNIEQMRLFYLEYPIPQTPSAELPEHPIKRSLSVKSDIQPIYETVSRKLAIPEFQLSWSHYQMLLRITDKDERSFYEIEAAKNQWSVRELKRQFDSALYIRLALSKDKKGIKTLATQRYTIEKPQDAIKNPYVLEFLGIKEHHRYIEVLLSLGREI